MPFNQIHLNYNYFLEMIKKERYQIYLNQTIQAFALSLIAIFIPIYLLILNYTLKDIILFLIIIQFFHYIFTPLAMKSARRFGLKHLILSRVILVIISLGLLNLLKYPQYTVPLWIISIISSLSLSMYWVPINTLFVLHSDKKKRGSQIGTQLSLPTIAAIIGPICGGVILAKFGFFYLFILSSILLCISVIPLFFSKDIKPKLNLNFKKIVKQEPRFSLAFMLVGGISVAATLVWPIYIYNLLDSIEIVGLASASISVGVILFTLVMGKIVDKKHKHTLRMVKVSAFVLGFLWIGRVFAFDLTTVLIFSTLGGLVGMAFTVPFMTLTMNEAARTNPSWFMTFRELSLTTGRSLMLIFLYFFSEKLYLGLVSAGILNFLILLL